MANTQILGRKAYNRTYDNLARTSKAFRTWYYTLTSVLHVLIGTPVVRPRGFWSGRRADGVQPQTIYMRASRLYAHEYGHSIGLEHAPWTSFDIMSRAPFRFRDEHGLLNRATSQG